MSNFLKSRELKTRVLTSLFLIIVIVPTYFYRDGFYFRLTLGIGYSLALIEFLTIFANTIFFPTPKDLLVSFVVFSELWIYLGFANRLEVPVIGAAVFICALTDISAYFSGKFLGKKLFKARPFPNASPNKTYEGCLGGFVFGVLAAFAFSRFENLKFTELVWMPSAAILGDALESFFKRRFGVKDSNDYLLSNPVLGPIESLLGGYHGHGGYLDRLDSVSFVLMVELAIILFSSF